MIKELKYKEENISGQFKTFTEESNENYRYEK